jgi:hypothetical protein
MINDNLRVITVALLKNRSPQITLKDISEKTTLPFAWLKSFQARGNELDSRSDRVVTLYEFLTQKKLKI